MADRALDAPPRRVSVILAGRMLNQAGIRTEISTLWTKTYRIPAAAEEPMDHKTPRKGPVARGMDDRMALLTLAHRPLPLPPPRVRRGKPAKF